MNLKQFFEDILQDPAAFLRELKNDPSLANAIQPQTDDVHIMSRLADGNIKTGFDKIGIVNLLLDNGADPRLVKIHGESMLHWAVSYGRYPFELMQRIMDYGIDVNLACKCELVTPLHVACQAGNLDGILFLLLNGANPNVAMKNGQTPLHTLVMSNPVCHGLDTLQNATKMLVEYGADQSATMTYKNELYTPADLVRRWISYHLRRPDQYNFQSLYDTFR